MVAARPHPVSPARSRLLVVDDDEASRVGLAKILRLSGYEVVTAADGDEAWQAVEASHEAGPFDAIISDVNMPGTDGYGLTAQLRASHRTRDIPVLLVSAVAPAERRARGIKQGADDFLEKPVDVDELIARLEARLHTAREKRELRRISAHDSLTGALNRHGTEVELRREIQRSRRTGMPVSVMMLDIDDFKRINDTWGHDAGDRALTAVGQHLMRLVRTTDRVGRFGGDEFLILLPDTDAAEARRLEARLRHAFHRRPPRPEGVPTVVRVSLGVATVATGDDTGRDAIRAADAAMYQDKRSVR